MGTTDTGRFVGGQAMIVSDFGDPAEPDAMVQVELRTVTFGGDCICLDMSRAAHLSLHMGARIIAKTRATLRSSVKFHFTVGEFLVVMCVGGTRIKLIPRGHPDCFDFSTEKVP